MRLAEYFDHHEGIAVLSTADRNGKVNAALYGRPHFIDEMEYEAYGIKNAMLIDNTVTMRDRAGLSRQLKAEGIDRILLTAPGKGDIRSHRHDPASCAGS
jgi:glyceraldehyde-3-phosphate dehydrogenase/erythrose-4-phosphate dehydrogenase